jgi:predicted metal-binding membrane protein
MTVMFALGVSSLVWMGALGALMLYEKTGPGGKRVVPVAGWALLAAGVVVLLHPTWLPAVVLG